MTTSNLTTSGAPASSGTPPVDDSLDEARCPFSSDNPRARFSGLNLVLELRDPEQMTELLKVIREAEDEIRYKMKRLNSVHFARFLPTRGNAALQVITEYDGTLETYLSDFVIEIGHVFNGMLAFIKNPPPLPIQEDPEAFYDFVRRNNRVTVPPFAPDEVSMFSAYPDKTVLEIMGKDQPGNAERAWWLRFEARQRVRDEDAINAPALLEDPVDAADVQANILAPLDIRAGCHFGLAFKADDPEAARAYLRALLEGAGGTVPVSSQQSALERRDGLALNVGFTPAGLRALGVPELILARFPTAFKEGPITRARANRDVGPHSPQGWELGKPDESIHILLSLHRHASPRPANDEASGGGTDADGAAGTDGGEADTAFGTAVKGLREQWRAAGLTEVFEKSVALLAGNRYHFGFRDQISQPTFRPGVPRRDGAPWSLTGDFLLGSGYRNAYGAPSLAGVPADLGQNGSFGVIRLLEQDVPAFEKMLDDASKRYGLCKEYLAAKMLGRWRNGMPLTQHRPLRDNCRECNANCLPTLDEKALDDFDFRKKPSSIDKGERDDFDGRICPVKSHVRRMNPRAARAAGRPWAHRIIRRGMPYGADYDAKNRANATGRGLFGVFYCSDIARQFEFLQQQWAYDDAPREKAILDVEENLRIRGKQAEDPYGANEKAGIGDPLCGGLSGPDTSDQATSAPGCSTAGFSTAGSSPPGFSFPCDATARDQGRVTLRWPKPLVVTKGSLYLFVPGLAALRHLADLGDLTERGRLERLASQLMAGGSAPMIPPGSRTQGPAAPTEPMPPGDFDRFNPMHPAFIADPYPYYEAFREQRPVARIRRGAHYSQIWVFSHELARQVCLDETTFPKPLQGWPRQGMMSREARDQRNYRGLMYLDGERHRKARTAIEPVLATAIEGIEQTATDLADRALTQIRAREFDAVQAYTLRAPREVFMTLAGIPEPQWQPFGELVETMLWHYNPLLIPAERAPYGVAARRVLAELTRLTPPAGARRGLFAMINDANHGLKPLETIQTCLHFALGGYLSTAFALGTGLHRLLSSPTLLAQYCATPEAVVRELLRHDPPFQSVERRFSAPPGEHDKAVFPFPFPLPETARAGQSDSLPRLRPDEAINVVLGSALRDPDGQNIKDPDCFDPAHSSTADKSWADSEVFGFGDHHCIGAVLATRLLPIYFERWFNWMPTAELASTPPVRIPDPAFRGFNSLPMRF